jgi:hypothetical protein
MKKPTKGDMGIRRCLYKLLRNDPQSCDRAVEGLEIRIEEFLEVKYLCMGHRPLTRCPGTVAGTRRPSAGR